MTSMINDYRALINMRAGETNDEYDVVWKITEDPRVLANKNNGTFYIRITKNTIKKGNRYKKKTGFKTRQDALNALLDFRLIHETPVLGASRGLRTLRDSGDTIRERAFNRVVTRTGWKRLTMSHWNNHAKLKHLHTYDEIPADVIVELNPIFGVFEALTKCQTNSLSFMRKRVKLLEDRCKKNQVIYERLAEKLSNFKAKDLIVVQDNTEERDLATFNDRTEGASSPALLHPPAKTITDTSVQRTIAQTLTTIALIKAMNKRDSKRCCFLASEISLIEKNRTMINAEVPNLDQIASDKKIADLRRVVEATRKKVETNIDLAKVIANESHAKYSARTIIKWYNQCVILGGNFLEDGRGRYVRCAIIGSVPGLKMRIQTFVRETRNVTGEQVRRFLNEALVGYIDGTFNDESWDDENAKGLKKFLDTRGIKIDTGISLSTTHMWMKQSGCAFCPSKQCYYTDNHNR